ncbi:MAG TPA: hypothetical protein PLU63_02190 [Candidatus Woesebacteria bacterium]|nr:hypothetical protein [Candidatus Woesebacteria bacterium]
MKQELKNHLLPLLGIFILTSILWLFQKALWYNYIFLFFGLFWGSFFLDIDHLIYWFYLEPNLEESRLAQITWKKGDFKSLIKLLESTHKNHTNLIFHHYFFQIIITLISFFVFTSSSGIFPKAFLLAINLHLLTDEIKDFLTNPEHLKLWLFAREKKQLPTSALKYYLMTLVIINLLFTTFLISSQ